MAHGAKLRHPVEIYTSLPVIIYLYPVRTSTISLLACYLVIALVHFGYYPKWQQTMTEATISYDVSGYYLYLPAAFIYEDLKEVKFLDDVMTEYRPTASPYQVFEHSSGNKVMKYSIGQAVMYAPWFAVGHAWASLSEAYPADGFSLPYQFMISFGSLVVSGLGLFWLTLVLRAYFPDKTVAWTVFLIAIGTNYLNYSAIDGAMTHNNVFSLAALLLLASHRFYVRANWTHALKIGACLGLMALTRPTEITAAIIPMLWGLDVFKKGALRQRVQLWQSHWPKLLAAVVLTLAIGSLQLLYWKYVSGDWVVYSYQDQGFDWFKAHIGQGLFSFKAGWLVYTPLMAFGLLGFLPLWRKQRALFSALFSHTIIFIYVAFAWSVWWYGGSLGQRTMVQEYAVLSFPFAAFLLWVFPPVIATDGGRAVTGARPQVQREVVMLRQYWIGRVLQGAIVVIILLFVWHNLWFTHQAHRGGLFVSERMTEAYFWKTLYTFSHNPENDLALDTEEFFPGEPDSREVLYLNDLENLSTAACGMSPINGKGSLCLVDAEQNGPSFYLDANLKEGTWVRATVSAKINAIRNNKNRHAQMVLSFRQQGEEIKRNFIRMHRVLNADWRRDVWLDGRVPAGTDQIVVSFWNGGDSQPALVLDDVKIERLE